MKHMWNAEKNKVSVFLTCVFLIVLVGSGQACGTFTSGTDTNASTSSTLDDQLALGRSLYQSNCASCHGDVATSTKIGRSALDIQNAISDQPSMKSLVFLSASDIEDIALALDPNQGSTALLAASYKPLVSNRYFIASNLTELFVDSVTPNADDAKISDLIRSTISAHPEAFGGNCTRNDPDCSSGCGYKGDISECTGKLSVLQNADPLPSVSAVRSGYVIQTCEQILSIDKSVKTLTASAGVSTSAAPTTATIGSLLAFVFPGQAVDAESVSKLAAVASARGCRGSLVVRAVAVRDLRPLRIERAFALLKQKFHALPDGSS